MIDPYDDGHKLIDRIVKKHPPWWGQDDLERHIRETSPKKPNMEFIDPKHNEYCAHLEGWFSIAELDAIVISLMNDRGRFEAS